MSTSFDCKTLLVLLALSRMSLQRVVRNIVSWFSILFLSPSGVATYGAFGHVPHSRFGNSVHSAAAASLTVKISKIKEEKHD